LKPKKIDWNQIAQKNIVSPDEKLREMILHYVDPIQLFRFIEPVQWGMEDTSCYLFVAVLVAFLSTNNTDQVERSSETPTPQGSALLFHHNVNNTSNGSSLIKKYFSYIKEN
jgi:hypothetical protein